ncbi:MAG TPA: carboxypeptidase-like regulatory domain-containing protein [Solirubrobacteraceae bacterium]
MTASAASRIPAPGSEGGDTLIEVVISAALISLVVVAVLFGLNSTNRATANSRARSQADVLAQQDEERLRSEPIKKLNEIERKETVKLGATTYTITTTSKYIADATSTASCTSSVAKADYLKTISTVTWPSMGPSGGVIETGVISPPADSALIVQVEESGTPLAGATVVATGPAPSASKYELETSTNGCAILALSPGEYAINVSKTGYVDPNGYANTREDLSVTRTVYLPAETTSKEGYNLGLAGKLQVSFTEATTPPPTPEGDSFVVYNTGMAEPATFPEPATIGTYKQKIETPSTIFPFTTKYTVYAGTCEADLPTRNGQSSNPEVLVAPGKLAEVTVGLAPVNMKVMSGTGPGVSTEGSLVTTGSGNTIDTGCNTKRVFTSTPLGALPKPGLPYGSYSMCVANGTRRWQGSFSNNTPTGPSTSWTNGGTSGGIATIYLGTSPSGSPSGTETGSCP